MSSSLLLDQIGPQFREAGTAALLENLRTASSRGNSRLAATQLQDLVSILSESQDELVVDSICSGLLGAARERLCDAEEVLGRLLPVCAGAAHPERASCLAAELAMLSPLAPGLAAASTLVSLVPSAASELVTLFCDRGGKEPAAAPLLTSIIESIIVSPPAGVTSPTAIVLTAVADAPSCLLQPFIQQVVVCVMNKRIANGSQLKDACLVVNACFRRVASLPNGAGAANDLARCCCVLIEAARGLKAPLQALSDLLGVLSASFELAVSVQHQVVTYLAFLTSKSSSTPSQRRVWALTLSRLVAQGKLSPGVLCVCLSAAFVCGERPLVAACRAALPSSHWLSKGTATKAEPTSVGTGEALEVLLPSGAFCSLLAAGADATLHMWATSIVLSVGPVGPLAHALLSSEPLHSGPLPPSSSSDTSSSSPWASPSSPLGAEAAAWVFAVCVLQKDPLVRLQGLLGMGRLAASPSSCASQLVLRYLPILRECASGDPSTLNRLLVTRVLALACCDDAAAPTCALALANLTQCQGFLGAAARPLALAACVNSRLFDSVSSALGATAGALARERGGGSEEAWALLLSGIVDLCAQRPGRALRLVGLIKTGLSSTLPVVVSLALSALKHLVESGCMRFDAAYALVVKSKVLSRVDSNVEAAVTAGLSVMTDPFVRTISTQLCALLECCASDIDDVKALAASVVEAAAVDRTVTQTAAKVSAATLSRSQGVVEAAEALAISTSVWLWRAAVSPCAALRRAAVSALGALPLWLVGFVDKYVTPGDVSASNGASGGLLELRVGADGRIDRLTAIPVLLRLLGQVAPDADLVENPVVALIGRVLEQESFQQRWIREKRGAASASTPAQGAEAEDDGLLSPLQVLRSHHKEFLAAPVPPGPSPVSLLALFRDGRARQVLGRLAVTLLWCYDPRATPSGAKPRILFRPAAIGEVASEYKKMLLELLSDVTWESPDSFVADAGVRDVHVGWMSATTAVSGWIGFVQRYVSAVVDGEVVSAAAKAPKHSSTSANGDDAAVAVVANLTSLCAANLASAGVVGVLQTGTSTLKSNAATQRARGATSPFLGFNSAVVLAGAALVMHRAGKVEECGKLVDLLLRMILGSGSCSCTTLIGLALGLAVAVTTIPATDRERLRAVFSCFVQLWGKGQLADIVEASSTTSASNSLSLNPGAAKGHSGWIRLCGGLGLGLLSAFSGQGLDVDVPIPSLAATALQTDDASRGDVHSRVCSALYAALSMPGNIETEAGAGAQLGAALGLSCALHAAPQSQGCTDTLRAVFHSLHHNCLMAGEVAASSASWLTMLAVLPAVKMYGVASPALVESIIGAALTAVKGSKMSPWLVFLPRAILHAVEPEDACSDLLESAIAHVRDSEGGYNSSAVYALSEASGFNPLLFGLAATRGATPGSVDVELLPLGSVPPRISAVLALAVQGAVSSSPLLSPPSTSAAVSGGVRVTHAQQVLCEVVGCLARGIGVLHPSLLFSPFVTSRQSHSVWGFAGSASSDEPVPLQAVDALPSLHSQCSKGTLLYSVLKTLHGFGPTSSPDALAVLLHCLCQCTLPPMPLRPVVALAHSMSAPDPHPLKVIAYEFALAHCERDLSLVQWLVSQCDNAPRLSPSCLEPLFSGIATLGLLLPPSRFLQLVGTVISAIEGFGSGAMWPHFGGVLASFDSAMETEASQASLSPALCQLLVPRVLSACPASVWSHREDPARAVVLSLVHALARLPPATVEPALFLSVEGTSGLLRDPRVAADALLALARCSLMSAGILDLQQAPVLRTWALRPGAVASSTVFSEEGEGPEEGLALSVLVGLGRAASTVPATQRSKWVQRLLEFCDTALSARQALTTCGNTLVVLSVTLKLWRLGSACSSTTALFWEDAAPPSLRCASASTPLAQACVLLESLPEELRVARTEGWVEEDGLSRISQVHRSLLQLPPTRLSPLDSSLLRRVLPFIQ